MNRFDYVKYDEVSQDIQNEFKIGFTELESMVDEYLHDGRAKSLVFTKLEEAYMWVGKAVRDSQIERGETALQEERKNG